jgi:uncharacterized protein YjbI with pentapeptide repeats
MNIQNLYQELKKITSDYVSGQATRALAAQMLVDQLCRIDVAAKSSEIAKSDKNRLFVLVLQHLSLVQRSPGTNSLRNQLKRGNLLLNSRPILVITGLDFSGLSLPEFNISNAMLIACNFDEADLRGAKIANCQLQGCSFRRADLSNADFRRSTLYGCGFEDANTRSAKGLV